MSIPIIIIHLAEREHLRWILAQAREFNPHSNIILIGDYTSKHYNFIEHEEIGNYFQEALTFQKIYKHRSHNSFSYELFCFQRWFVLKQFMKTKGIEKCFCMDSDVMLYADIEEEQKKFADFDLALYQKWNPHCVFVNSLKNLREFCSFLVELYTNSVKFKALELEFQDRIKNKIGAICDMVAFRSFRDLDPNRIGDLSLILNNSTYDNNINYSEGFEMSNARKNIQFIDNKPFCMHLELGKKIRFNALHLQGYAKQYIQDYFTGDKEKIRDIKLWGINTFDSRDKTNENYQQGKSMIKYVALPLKLGEINLIIFPDWSDSGQSLDSDLERVISAIATHPDSSQITLLVYLGRLSQEEANLALSGAMLNLLMQEELEMSEEPEITFVGQLDEIQWKALFNLVQARIILETEDQQAIAAFNAENLPACAPESLSQKRAVQQETGSWVLQETVSSNP